MSDLQTQWAVLVLSCQLQLADAMWISWLRLTFQYSFIVVATAPRPTHKGDPKRERIPRIFRATHQFFSHLQVRPVLRQVRHFREAEGPIMDCKLSFTVLDSPEWA